MSLSLPGKRMLDHVEPSYFDGAEPQFSEFAAAEDELRGVDYEPLPGDVQALLATNTPAAIDAVMSDAVPSVLRRPVDHALVKKFDPRRSRHPDAYCLSRIRQISRKQARGKLSRECPVALRITRAVVLRNGTWAQSLHDHLGYAAGRWWPENACWTHASIDRRSPVRFNTFKLQELVMVAQLSINAQRDADAGWRVLLGWDGYPRITFVTDAAGVREVFRLRDIPDGKARRIALRHWVTSHWRKTQDEDVDHKVRAHLRGATEFRWNGLSCKIIPSIEDRQTNTERLGLRAPEHASDGDLAALFGSDAMRVDPEQPRSEGVVGSNVPAARRYKGVGVEIHNVAANEPKASPERAAAAKAS
jgi:hypothetical protein